MLDENLRINFCRGKSIERWLRTVGSGPIRMSDQSTRSGSPKCRRPTAAFAFRFATVSRSCGRSAPLSRFLADRKVESLTTSVSLQWSDQMNELPLGGVEEELREESGVV